MSVVLKQNLCLDSNGLLTGSTIPFSSNVVAGDALIFILVWYTAFNPTITDSQGNTYARSGIPYQSGAGDSWFVFTAVAGSSGPCTLTIHAAGGTNAWGGTLFEVSGLQTSPLDQLNVNTNNTSGALSAGTITPTVNGEYVVGIFSRRGIGNTYTNGSFTVESTSPSNGTICLSDFIQTTAGSLTPTVNGASGASYPVYGVAVSFISSGGGPTPPTDLRMGMGF